MGRDTIAAIRFKRLLSFLPPLKNIINFLFVVFLCFGILFLSTRFKGTLHLPVKYDVPDPFHAEPHPTPFSPNYSPEICDDAFKSDVRHDDETIAYFDVKLHEGCFSGYVGFPKKWTSWQSQLLHNEPNTWVAFWWSGWDRPNGPYTGPQLIAPEQQQITVPSTYVRLQGKGTLRIYCTGRDCPIK